MHTVNRNPSSRELHKFGWAMVLGFGVLGTLGWYFAGETNGWAWRGETAQRVAVAFWTLGPLLLVISFGPKALAKPVYIGWMSVGFFIGGIMTAILLSVLFIVLLPVFSLVRFADPLRMKLRPPGESYWEDHKHHESTLERTIRPF
ncbi:MAG: hypothetical protein H6817_09500 [Phycisphaerales bacterium]|nr:hypothetical protein [Phycisphaerales bacterium]